MLSQIEKNKLISYVKNTSDMNIYADEVSNLLSKNNRNRKDISLVILSFLSDYTINLLKKDDATVNTICRFLSAIVTFIGWVSEDGLGIDNDILNNIRSIYRLFKEFIARTGKESSVEIVTVLDIIVKLVGNEEKIDTELNDLNIRIKELSEEIKNKSKVIEELEELIKSKDKDINSKKRKIEKISQELEEKKREIDELLVRISDYTSDINRLNIENRGLSNYIESLTEDNRDACSKIKELSGEIAVLKQIISELEKRNNELLGELERIRKDEDIDDEIVEEIIKLLFVQDMSEEDIVKSLKGKVKYDNFNRLIRKAKDKVCIGNPSISIHPSYSIIVPPIMENRTFNINNSNLTFDVLLTSDYHLTLNHLVDSYDVIERYEDYCEENGINLIINLGDIFGFKYEDVNRYDKYLQGKDLVKKVIETLPSRNGIYHAILGGNHDQDSLSYGYDAINMLTKDREDMIDLGYTHALVTFDRVRSPLSNILLHHIDRRITDPVSYSEYNDFEYKRYLDTYSRLSGRDAYVHLLGGAHVSGIYNNFILVPSATCDRRCNGATRLRIYFDIDNNISNIVVVPLVVKDRVEEVTEMVYTKSC